MSAGRASRRPKRSVFRWKVTPFHAWESLAMRRTFAPRVRPAAMGASWSSSAWGLFPNRRAGLATSQVRLARGAVTGARDA